jgi:hypothetical protein
MANILYKNDYAAKADTCKVNGLPHTEENIIKLEAEVMVTAAKYDEDNKALYATLLAAWQAFHDAMLPHVEKSEMTGRAIRRAKTTKSWQAVLDAKPAQPSPVASNVKYSLESMKRRAKEAAYKAEHEVTAKKRATENAALNSRAIVFLVKEGAVLDGVWSLNGEFVCNVGNEADGAFLLVTGRAEDEMMKDDEVLYHDCCDYCSEWTLGERRCSCGNRRMSLNWAGTFEEYSYYVEAY